MEFCHYTKIESAQKIAESKRLWATAFETMEDKSELTYGLTQVLNFAMEDILQMLPNDLRKQENLRDWRRIFSEEPQELFLQLKNQLITNLKPSSVFFACFTNHTRVHQMTNGNIHHWGKFAGYDGCCFHFSENKINSIISSENEFGIRPEIIFSKVNYGNTDFEEKYRDLITFFTKEILRKTYSICGDDILKPIIARLEDKQISQNDLLSLILFNKDPSFEIEEEWRLVVIPTRVPQYFPSPGNPRFTPGIFSEPVLHVNLGRTLKDGFIPDKITTGPRYNASIVWRNYYDAPMPVIQKSNIPI